MMGLPVVEHLRPNPHLYLVSKEFKVDEKFLSLVPVQA